MKVIKIKFDYVTIFNNNLEVKFKHIDSSFRYRKKKINTIINILIITKELEIR